MRKNYVTYTRMCTDVSFLPAFYGQCGKKQAGRKDNLIKKIDVSIPNGIVI